MVQGSGKLAGKAAIITGGASGIGAAAVRLFAMEGADVAVADLDERRGLELIGQLKADGHRAIFVKTDISKKDGILSLLEQAKAAFGKINILISNAGLQGPLAPTAEYPLEAWHQLIGVDLRGTFLLCKYGLPHLIEQGGGSVVVTGSLSAFDAAGMVAGYAAAKAAVCSLTKAMAYDYGKYQIRVNAICPASVSTALLQKGVADMNLTPEEEKAYLARQLSGYPLGRLGTPEDIARLMLFLAGEDSSFMTGGNIIIDGGYWAGIPGVS